MARFLQNASQQLERWPSLKKRIVELRYWIWRSKLKIRSRAIDKAVDLDKTHFINPKRIIYAQKKEFLLLEDKGKVISGDWDLPKNRIRFKDLDVYQAFYQRFVNHKNWSETGFYHRVLGEILDGNTKWNCKSREQLDDRCKQLDELYQNIRDNGYKTQRELHDNSRGLFEEDEIAISIARTGEFLFNNGRHRLSIAKILDLKEVPVKITVIHSEWIRILPAFRKV